MRRINPWGPPPPPAAKPAKPARKVGPDFHLVELTEDGRALAGGTPLRISNGRISVLFPADGEPVKIARFEWDMLLRDHAHADGRKLFAVVVPDDEQDESEVTNLESADPAEENE